MGPAAQAFRATDGPHCAVQDARRLTCLQSSRRGVARWTLVASAACERTSNGSLVASESAPAKRRRPRYCQTPVLGVYSSPECCTMDAAELQENSFSPGVGERVETWLMRVRHAPAQKGQLPQNELPGVYLAGEPFPKARSYQL